MSKRVQRSSEPKQQASDPAVLAARYAFYTAIVTAVVAPLVLRIADALLK